MLTAQDKQQYKSNAQSRWHGAETYNVIAHTCDTVVAMENEFAQLFESLAINNEERAESYTQLVRVTNQSVWIVQWHAKVRQLLEEESCLSQTAAQISEGLDRAYC